MSSDLTKTIAPTRGWLDVRLREVWNYRELLFFLTWRDVKVRYKQTFFGAAWAVIQPFMLMVVFSVFLADLVTGGGSFPSDIPYPIFTMTALVPWTLFAQSLMWSSTSLVSGANLVSKIYFPRLILPLAATGSFLLDFVIALVVLVGMMLINDITPSSAVIWLPVFTLLALVSALAFGIWLSAINARYRDVQYAIPFLIQLLLFASPIAYPSGHIQDRIGPLYGLNPMAGVVEGFRWALLGTERPGGMIVVSAVAAVALFIGGVFYFRKVERTIADVI